MFSFAQKEPKGDLEREEFSPPGGDTVRLPLRKLDAHGGPGPRSNDGVRVQGQVEAWKGTNGGFLPFLISSFFPHTFYPISTHTDSHLYYIDSCCPSQTFFPISPARNVLLLISPQTGFHT